MACFHIAGVRCSECAHLYEYANGPTPYCTGCAALREENVRLTRERDEVRKKLVRCVEAASDVAEGACSFKDSRLSYEEWQINVGSMERLRAAIAGEAMPRGWLIESTLSHGGGPRWWQGKQPGTEEQWTGSHTAAIRFARREDAEACRLTLGDAHVSKVTEHVWL